MTNVNGVNYAQQVTPIAYQTYAQQTVPQYITAPYANDAFVSSKTQEKKSNHPIAKLLLTAGVVIGGAIAARKFTPLKNYTKITENASLKQKLANIVTTVADKSTEISKKGIAKAKSLASKIGEKFAKTGASTAQTATETAKFTPEQLIKAQTARKVAEEEAKKVSPSFEFFYNNYMKK